MASSFNAGAIVQAFVQTAPQFVPVASQVGQILSVPNASAFRLSGRALGGAANTLASNATSTTLSDAFTYENSFSIAKQYIHHKIPKHKLLNDVALRGAGSDMAAAVAAAMDKAYVAGMVGLFAQAHPRVGTAAGQVGAGKYFLDTGLKYLTGESGEATQDNLITSALSEAALNTAIKLLLQYRSDRGAPMGIGSQGGLVLMVAPKNAQTAHELVVSQLSGSDMASNFVRGLVSQVVVSPFLADSDDDDWFLADPKFNPCVLGVAQAPMVEVNLSDDAQFVHIVGSYEAAFGYAPYEGGLIGSNVA
jgi:hypothetical protein